MREGKTRHRHGRSTEAQTYFCFQQIKTDEPTCLSSKTHFSLRFKLSTSFIAVLLSFRRPFVTADSLHCDWTHNRWKRNPLCNAPHLNMCVYVCVQSGEWQSDVFFYLKHQLQAEPFSTKSSGMWRVNDHWASLQLTPSTFCSPVWWE